MIIFTGILGGSKDSVSFSILVGALTGLYCRVERWNIPELSLKLKKIGLCFVCTMYSSSKLESEAHMSLSIKEALECETGLESLYFWKP